MVIRTTRKILDDNGFEKVIIIAGTGTQSTRETKALCKDAAEAGAHYALVLTPSTWLGLMGRDGIARFHREVADASPIPTMIYNFPTVTAGLDLDSDMIESLAQHPNIVGTKLSCGNVGKLHRLTSSCPRTSFAVYSGKSDVVLQGLMSGSAGAITALVNLAPKAHVRLYQLWAEGNVKEAMDIQALLGHADGAVSKIGGVGGLKAVVSKHFGYGDWHVRGPLNRAADEALSGSGYEKLVRVVELEKTL